MTPVARLNGALLSPTTLALLTLGTGGAILFSVVWLIEGATRPGYNAWTQPISALSLGPGGWIQRADFIVFGVLVLCSALGWRQALAQGLGAVAYPVLRTVEGIGLIVDGVFSQDPTSGYPPGTLMVGPTLHGVVHVIFAVVTITAVAASWLILARRLAAEPGWRRWGRYAVITAALNIVFIAIFGTMGAHGGLAGLFERLSTEASLPLSLLIIGRLLLQAREGALGRRPSVN